LRKRRRHLEKKKKKETREATKLEKGSLWLFVRTPVFPTKGGLRVDAAVEGREGKKKGEDAAFYFQGTIMGGGKRSRKIFPEGGT